MVTVALLAFVVASVVYLIVTEAGSRPAQPEAQANERLSATEQDSPEPASSEARSGEHKVIVYYFHGTARCATCRTIELYTTEAIEGGFPEALKDGRLELRVVNADLPENEHYVQDFQLVTKSVVIVDERDGKQARWKNLQSVWELVQDKASFLGYIQGQTQAYLEAEGT